MKYTYQYIIEENINPETSEDKIKNLMIKKERNLDKEISAIDLHGLSHEMGGEILKDLLRMFKEERIGELMVIYGKGSHSRDTGRNEMKEQAMSVISESEYGVKEEKEGHCILEQKNEQVELQVKQEKEAGKPEGTFQKNRGEEVIN